MQYDDATTKGTILRSLVKFVRSELTPEQFERVLSALPAADRQLVGQTSMLATQKVPEFTLNRLTEQGAKAKGESVDAFGRRAGGAELRDAVGVYRFLTVVLTPTALLRKASALWSTVHSHGELSVASETSHTARVRLTAFPSEEAHCARLTGWFEGAGELTGAKNTKVVHTRCICRGDDACEWDLAW